MTIRRLQAQLLLDAHAEHGESPAWDQRRRELLWVDMFAASLHSTSAEGVDAATTYDQPVCFALPRAAGGLALGLGDGLWLESPERTRRRVFTLRQPADGAAVRMNDGKCDPAGGCGAARWRMTPGQMPVACTASTAT